MNQDIGDIEDGSGRIVFPINPLEYPETRNQIKQEMHETVEDFDKDKFRVKFLPNPNINEENTPNDGEINTQDIPMNNFDAEQLKFANMK
jgi:hypothetical protein